LLADCVLAVLTDLVADAQEAGGVWDEAGFEALRQRARAEVGARAVEVRSWLLRVLAAARETDRLLAGRVDLSVLPSMNDMRQHLGRLTAPGFVGEAGAARLREHPRYLAALDERRRRLDASPARDLELMGRVGEFQAGWEQRVAALPAGRPPGRGLERLRWLVEEYRVSLWAQHLGTAEPVSDTRLRKALQQA
jgi:ATP-dependent helicase HrpA